MKTLKIPFISNPAKFNPTHFLVKLIACFFLVTIGVTFTALTAWGTYSNPLYLGDIPGTELGALIWGGAGGSYYGETVASVGDVNGDGYDDVIIAGERANVGYSYGGEAILFYGTGGTFGSSMVFNIFSDTMSASQGVRFRGTAINQRLGRSVAGAGDVNGDGYNDFLIGSDENSPKGTVYLIYGKNSQVSSNVYFSLNSSTLNGTNGVAIVGNTDDYIGYANQISGAGDVNGDGYDDILIAGDNKVYLIYGSADGMGTSGRFDLADFESTDGVLMTGSGSIQSLGYSVSGAGDVNGDGYDDILLGAWKVYLAPSSTDDTGGGIILYGSETGIGSGESFEISETILNDTNGTRFIGPSPMGSGAGSAVSGLGDVNGDGYSDFVIGASNWGYWESNPNQGNGRVYLVYGDSDPLGSSGALFMINLNGSNGVKLNGPTNYIYAGRRLSSAGDVNGDGLADIIIPAYYGDSQAGRTYVIYGKQGTIYNGSDYDLGSIYTQNGTNMIGANLYGASEDSGSDVSTAGDFNGDGKSDLLIGAYKANNPDSGSVTCGKAYLLWGDGFPDSAVVKAFTRTGDAPKRGIGMTGDGKHTYPLSRVWIDYDGGSALGEASLETVTFYRDTPSGSGLPEDIASGYWQVTTNRTGWSAATLTFKYTSSDIGLMNKENLSIYQSDSPTGPFTRLETTSNTSNETLSATVTEFSYFAIGEFSPSADSDGDGTPDVEDGCPNDPNKTAPGTCGCGVADTDTDGDGTPDCNDNCPNMSNPTQSNNDYDGYGDACDPDDDNDGMPDDWEALYSPDLNPLVDDADSDPDDDGFSNIQEYQSDTNPKDPYSHPDSNAVNVLLLGDNGSETEVQQALEDAGYNVTYGGLYYEWDGSNPNPENFGVIIYLGGYDYSYTLQDTAATAVSNFVANGGGLILTEWTAYEVYDGDEHSVIETLMPVYTPDQDYDYGDTWTVQDTEHPLTQGVPGSWEESEAGWSHVTAKTGTVVLITGTDDNPLLSYSNVNGGTVVYINHDMTYSGDISANTLQLLVNAADYASYEEDDTDTDNDGLLDIVEDKNQNGTVDAGETDPQDPDTDNDGLLDGVEDANHDGVVDADETDPLVADTDSDGLSDGVEDANHDGIVDAGETDPLNDDTDGDGMPDGWEVEYDLDPLFDDSGYDTDKDGFDNLTEYERGKDPQDPANHPARAMPWLPLLLGDD